MLYTCSIFGLGLLANRPIPGVPQTNISAIDIHLSLGELPSWLPRTRSCTDVPWYASDYKDESGQPAFKIFELAYGNYFHLTYSDQTQFVVDRAGENIWSIWPDTLTLEDTATYLLGPVMGFVLQLRGRISLHASAVVIADRAIALVGPAGSGKSTTAAAFADRGFRVLAEDVATLEDRGDSFLVLPAYPCIRLWPASVRALYGSDDVLPKLTPNWDKCYLDLNQDGYQFAGEAIPLTAIYLLDERKEEAAAPYVSDVSSSNALISLIANTYTTRLMDKEMRARGFQILSRVQSRVPVREVTPHTDPSRIGELCATIVSDFQMLQLHQEN